MEQRGGRRRTWDDEFVLKRQFSALVPAFDPRPGRTNVQQTQDIEIPPPGICNKHDSLFGSQTVLYLFFMILLRMEDSGSSANRTHSLLGVTSLIGGGTLNFCLHSV